VLSPHLYLSRNGIVSRASSIDETGRLTIAVDERLQTALEDAIASSGR